MCYFILRFLPISLDGGHEFFKTILQDAKPSVIIQNKSTPKENQALMQAILESQAISVTVIQLSLKNESRCEASARTNDISLLLETFYHGRRADEKGNSENIPHHDDEQPLYLMYTSGYN